MSALTVAEKVSVVDAQGDGAQAQGLRVMEAPPVPADSDYNTDRSIVYVQERSVESFNTVNEILCMMAQTRYDAMLNQGPYKAQVDVSQCEGRDDASAGGQQSANQSSSADMPEYELWTVESSRADNTAPQIVKVWVHESGDEFDPDKVIYARAVVTEGVSATNPYGLFTLNFDGHPVVDGVPSPQSMFKGVLKTELVDGKVMLTFFDAGSFGPESYSQAAVLDRSADGLSGGGTLRNERSGGPGPEAVSGSGPQIVTFNIAYNSTNFRRVGGVSDVCLARDQFDESAWRYGVYDSNGARVARNSGFPVRFSQGGQDYHGYIGYWGPWFPDNVTLSTGDSVYKQTFGPGGGTETLYEVLVSGGKLKKHTRNVLTLADVAGIPLDYMEGNGSPNDNQYRVLWNGTVFTKVAQMNKTNWTWQNLSPPVELDLGALRFSELNFWSQALGGSVQVKLQGCALDNNGTFEPNDDTFSCTAGNTTPVISYAEATIDPSDSVPATLACFENCPDVANLTGPNPFFPFMGYQPVPPADATRTNFAFDSASMVLKAGATAVVATTLDPSFQWGLMSGPLFDPTTANLDLLRCPWDNNTCAWQARSNLPVYYTWETGPNNWNRFVALKEPVLQSFVSFDPPLLLQYTHSGNGYANAKFYLEYGGFGDLHGIPGKCVNMDTGSDADCASGGPGSPIRWVPEFTIPDGSTAATGSATYYIKALEKEQRMQSDPGGCTGLTITDYSAQLPTVADWTDPAIGTEPVVTDPPAVIGGVLQ